MKINLTGDQTRLCPELAWNRPVRATDLFDVERAMRLYPDREYPRYVDLPGALMTAKYERVLELELKIYPDESVAELWALVPKVFEGQRRPVRMVRAVMGAEMLYSLRDPGAKGQLARELIRFAEASRNPAPTGIESSP